MQKNKLLFWFLGWIILAGSERTECATIHDFQTWFNLTTTGKIYSQDKVLSKLRYWLEGQERLGDDSSRFTQTLLRPGIGYALTENLTLWIGYAWIATGQPITTNPFEEERMWQQLLWVKTYSAYTLTSRTRTEQRFLENTPKTAYRIRQLIKFSVPFKKNNPLRFVTSDEVFIHKNDFVGRNSRGFDQNRFFLGLGYQFNQKAATEIGYMNQYVRRVGVPNFQANILSINFFLNF